MDTSELNSSKQVQQKKVNINNVYFFEKIDSTFLVSIDYETVLQKTKDDDPTYIFYLSNIFDNKVVQKVESSTNNLQREFLVSEYDTDRDSEIYLATLSPLVEIKPDLLENYPDGIVPLDILQNSLDMLNNKKAKIYRFLKKYIKQK